MHINNPILKGIGMRKLVVTIILLLIAMSAETRAQTRHVPSEYVTIQAAIDDCVYYDTVIVAEGTYFENIQFGGRNITLKSTNPEDPRIVASTIINGNSLGSTITFSGTETTSCIMSGFTITGGYNMSTGGGIDGSGSRANIALCNITGNHGANGGGIRYSRGLISNCVITNNTASVSGGALSLCHNGTVADCIISNNRSSQYAGGIGYSSQIIIYNSLIMNNTAPKGGGIGSPHGGIIANCTIVGNSSTSSGAGGVYYGENATMYNSIVWDNTPNQIDSFIRGRSSYCCIQFGTSEIANFSSNPKFVDPNNRDYHLLSNSPCIEHGHPTYPPRSNTDFDGNPRILGRVPDVGMYEHVFEEPHIGGVPWSISFGAFQERANPDPQILSIYNSGTGIVVYAITEDCAWLDNSPTSGTLTTELDELTISVDTTGLNWGTYDCNIVITDPCVTNSPVVLPVSLTVIGPILSVNPSTLNFQTSVDSPILNSNFFSIQNIGGGTLYWQLIEDCNWLDVSSLSGSCVEEVEEVDLVVDATGLLPGRYSYDLVVSDETNTATVTINLTHFARDPLPMNLIQQRIDDANNGDVITVEDGIYAGSGQALDFHGKAITLRSANGPNGCIIDCNFTNGGFYFHSGEDTNSVVDGFTVINGTSDKGGGIYIDESSPTIRNCVVTDNYADYVGGIYMEESSAVIDGCFVGSNNQRSTSNAASIKSVDGSAVIKNSIIVGSLEYGCAGIHLWRDSTTVKSCIISHNNGIGIKMTCAQYSSIENCIISGNSSSGIYMYGSEGRCGTRSPKITNCTIVGNSYGIYWTDEHHRSYLADPIVTNCIIWDNSYSQIIDLDETLSVCFSNIQGSWPGTGNINVDPCFADPGYWDDDTWVDGDYHLKSEGWCWNPDRQMWIWNTVSSRCQDAGMPDSPLGDEPLSVPADSNNSWGQNIRVNMGVYGSTEEASIPPYDWSLLYDLNNDGIVNFTDFAFIFGWAYIGNRLFPERDPNMTTLSGLADDWLSQTIWFK